MENRFAQLVAKSGILGYSILSTGTGHWCEPCKRREGKPYNPGGVAQRGFQSWSRMRPISLFLRAHDEEGRDAHLGRHRPHPLAAQHSLGYAQRSALERDLAVEPRSATIYGQPGAITNTTKPAPPVLSTNNPKPLSCNCNKIRANNLEENSRAALEFI